MEAKLGLSHWGSVFENRVLRYLGLSGTRYQGSGSDCIVRSFLISTPH